MPFTKKENLFKLMVDCLHCKERKWDLVGELEKGRDVTMQYIIYGNYCEILASCRKRWPMELTTTMCDYDSYTSYHTPNELHDFVFFPK